MSYLENVMNIVKPYGTYLTFFKNTEYKQSNKYEIELSIFTKPKVTSNIENKLNSELIIQSALDKLSKSIITFNEYEMIIINHSNLIKANKTDKKYSFDYT